LTLQIGVSGGEAGGLPGGARRQRDRRPQSAMTVSAASRSRQTPPRRLEPGGSPRPTCVAPLTIATPVWRGRAGELFRPSV